jgi:hypothetical protein
MTTSASAGPAVLPSNAFTTIDPESPVPSARTLANPI